MCDVCVYMRDVTCDMQRVMRILRRVSLMTLVLCCPFSSLICLRPDGHVTLRIDLQREGLQNEVLLCSQASATYALAQSALSHAFCSICCPF